MPDVINKLVQSSAGSVPNLSEAVIAKFAIYVEQNVTPSLNSYLAVGVIMAVGGFVLVAMGDRKKAKLAKDQPLESQVHLKQQD